MTTQALPVPMSAWRPVFRFDDETVIRELVHHQFANTNEQPRKTRKTWEG